MNIKSVFCNLGIHSPLTWLLRSCSNHSLLDLRVPAVGREELPLWRTSHLTARCAQRMCASPGAALHGHSLAQPQPDLARAARWVAQQSGASWPLLSLLPCLVSTVWLWKGHSPEPVSVSFLVLFFFLCCVLYAVVSGCRGKDSLFIRLTYMHAVQLLQISFFFLDYSHIQNLKTIHTPLIWPQQHFYNCIDRGPGSCTGWRFLRRSPFITN